MKYNANLNKSFKALPSPMLIHFKLVYQGPGIDYGRVINQSISKSIYFSVIFVRFG